MTMADLAAGLRRRAKACRDLEADHAAGGDEVGVARLMGKAQAYEHAAELVEDTPAEAERVATRDIGDVDTPTRTGWADVWLDEAWRDVWVFASERDGHGLYWLDCTTDEHKPVAGHKWRSASSSDVRLLAAEKRWADASRKLQAELADECDRLDALVRAVEAEITVLSSQSTGRVDDPSTRALARLTAALDAAKGMSHTCTRCGSELDLSGLEWPDPQDYADGDRFAVWVDCHVEADGGGDPVGEFDDGDACEETNFIYRVVQSDGKWGPVSQDRETST